MAVFRSVIEYRKAMQARINELKRAGDRSCLAAAKHQVMQAKRMAPAQAGTLRANIRKRKLSQGRWVAESWVPGSFKYNKWVNQSKGFRTLVYKRPNPRFGLKIGDRIIYGRTPAWNWTGLPGFWDLASNMTRRHFGRVAIMETRKALRVKA